MNYLADRRQPVASARLTTDRLMLPWHPLQDARSRVALVAAWLAMSAILLLVAYTQLDAFRAQGLATPAAPPVQLDALVPIVLPLLQLLVALVLVRQTLRCLDFTGAAANLGLAIVPLLPLAVASFTPMRVDEAGWQALCGLFTLRMLVDRRKAAAKAGLAGTATAVLAMTFPEGIWLAAAAMVFQSVEYLRSGRGLNLTAFCIGIALGIAAFIAATTPVEHWTLAGARLSSWPPALAWGASGTVAAALCCRARAPAMLYRIVALAAVFGTAGSIFAMSGWIPHTGLPGWQATLPAGYISGNAGTAPSQWHDGAGMVAATLALWLAASLLRRRDFARSANPRGWLAVVILSGTMAVLALFSPRAALLAQVLAIPLIALMLRDALRVASRFASAPGRVMAIALALLALTPTGGALAATLAVSLVDGKPLGLPTPISHVAVRSGASQSPD